MNYEYAVIGGGVVGGWTAYELSKYTASLCILEKENDVAMGVTKANSAIVHAGYDPEVGTLKARLNVRGNQLIRERAKALSIPFRQIGSLVVAFNDEGEKAIAELYERGLANGVPDLRIMEQCELLKSQPHLSSDARSALWAGTAGVVSAFELAIAPIEVALNNGATLYRNFEANSIKRGEDGYFTIESVKGETVRAKTIVNASGLYGDRVAEMIGDDRYEIKPVRGEYSILDNSYTYLTDTVIFQPPTSAGKGILVSQTVDGNILIGPTAEAVDEKNDRDTTPEGQKKAWDGARVSVPEVREGMTITSFSGLRPKAYDKNTGKVAPDFIIGWSPKAEGLYNLIGIESPGLTAAPAIGEYAARELVGDAEIRKDWTDGREVIRMAELSDDEKSAVIARDPRYGRIICRCESISEGEIVAAIQRPAGAMDVDGVKRRVRAGMGRCQGGFCGPRVMEILARELDIPEEEVTKFGRASKMVEGRL